MVFSSALYDDPAWRVPQFQRSDAGQAHPGATGQDTGLARRAPQFIEAMASG